MHPILKLLIIFPVLLLSCVSALAKDTLNLGERLLADQYLQSPNASFRLYMQADGNLVLRNAASNALWSTGTNGKGAARAELQGDGNLVLYTTAGQAVWSTSTHGKGVSRATLQNDGNFVLYTAANQPVWATNTSIPPATSGRARIAFVGDSGTGANFQGVLNLIKSEGAEMTMFLGDTAYSGSNDTQWNNQARSTLGSSDPVLLALGNHDVESGTVDSIISLGQARLNNQSAVKCVGKYGQRMTCTYKNLYFVVSGIGSIGSVSDSEAFIASSLNVAPANAWRICAWHKNQRQMQVGGKSDETGWSAYETCRRKGAFIATGHEHSYSRTHLLSSMVNRTVASTSSTFTISPGNSFAFVSGLGGIGIRDQEISGNWWAKVYTSTQGAKYGVLFGDFYADRAEFYFKNVAGQVIDRFTVQKGY